MSSLLLWKKRIRQNRKKKRKKETVQKTVAEQVQAPETYQTTIQADLRSAGREDKETPMNFTLTADAPIKSAGCRCNLFKKSKKIGDS